MNRTRIVEQLQDEANWPSLLQASKELDWVSLTLAAMRIRFREEHPKAVLKYTLLNPQSDQSAKIHTQIMDQTGAVLAEALAEYRKEDLARENESRPDPWHGSLVETAQTRAERRVYQSLGLHTTEELERLTATKEGLAQVLSKLGKAPTLLLPADPRPVPQSSVTGVESSASKPATEQQKTVQGQGVPGASTHRAPQSPIRAQVPQPPMPAASMPGRPMPVPRQGTERVVTPTPVPAVAPAKGPALRVAEVPTQGGPSVPEHPQKLPDVALPGVSASPRIQKMRAYLLQEGVESSRLEKLSDNQITEAFQSMLATGSAAIPQKSEVDEPAAPGEAHSGAVASTNRAVLNQLRRLSTTSVRAARVLNDVLKMYGSDENLVTTMASTSLIQLYNGLVEESGGKAA